MLRQSDIAILQEVATMTLTKEQIIEREQKIFAEAVQQKQDPAWWIAKDRAERWTEFVAAQEVRTEIAEWVATMRMKHDKAVCRYYNNTVTWVMALLICRYGEAEYHWPADGFTDDDIKRADQWLKGTTPDGVVYL